MAEEKVDEGKKDVEEIQPDKDGKYPDTIPWDKYVGVKEMLTKSRGKVSSLEEQLKGAASAEELNRIKQELESTKTEHQKVFDELKSTKEKSVSEKREFLKSKGIPEDELKDMSEEALELTVRALEHYKPKPDLSGGGGGFQLKGSPMELARQAYSQGK